MNAKRIGSWLVIAAAALTVQGCWEEEQERLTLLGEGGCRTADDTQGTVITISGVSFDECEAKCFEDNGQCIAVEYNTNNRNCEIHAEPITKFVEIEGVFCYQRR